VSELEKDLRLKVLSLKDVQKELDTEKVVSSKVYNEVRRPLVILHIFYNNSCRHTHIKLSSGYTPVIITSLLIIITGALPSSRAW
jgi:hypothetical protein